jgi:hypothetical protein
MQKEKILQFNFSPEYLRKDKTLTLAWYPSLTFLCGHWKELDH